MLKIPLEKLQQKLHHSMPKYEQPKPKPVRSNLLCGLKRKKLEEQVQADADLEKAVNAFIAKWKRKRAKVDAAKVAKRARKAALKARIAAKKAAVKERSATKKAAAKAKAAARKLSLIHI